MNRPRKLWPRQAGLLVAIFGFWHLIATPGLLPNFMFDNDRQAAFFFGQPAVVAQRIWRWFVTDADIYRHLGVTLTETLAAFAIGSVLGLLAGLWLALFVRLVPDKCPVQIVIAPPFVSLAKAQESLTNAREQNAELAAQNMSQHPAGAYTGEISARMIKGAAASMSSSVTASGAASLVKPVLR